MSIYLVEHSQTACISVAYKIQAKTAAEAKRIAKSLHISNSKLPVGVKKDSTDVKVMEYTISDPFCIK